MAAPAVAEELRLEGLPEVHDLGQGAQSVMAETSLRLNGKPVRLQFIVWKPEGEGPFPLLLFNHGSTGRGTDTTIFRQPRLHGTIARYFNEHGWMMVTPMRRGRGWSDGLYDEGFGSNRASGYACRTARSLKGAERAMMDVLAALTVLKDWSSVDPTRVVIGGQSRGGILSVAFAGRHPQEVKGVLNFVGGWMGEGCPNAAEINGSLARQGGAFPQATLWLYGDDDPFYSLGHSRRVFRRFEGAGGRGTFVAVSPPRGMSGHVIASDLELWREPVAAYLRSLGFTEFGTTTAARQQRPDSEKVGRSFPGANSKYCGSVTGLRLADGTGLDADLSRFIGVYDGYWAGQLSHTLIISRVTAGGHAEGYYAHGVVDGWRIDRPGCGPVRGQIHGNEVVFTLRNSARVTYRFRGKDMLEGSYLLRGRTTPGLFQRVSKQ